jgi:hypothetical protein
MKPNDHKQLLSGFTFLGLGLVFLAINFGWLQLDFVAFFWRFWPLLLVLFGLRFLINNMLIYAAIAVVLLGAAVWSVSYAPESIRNQINGNASDKAGVQAEQKLDQKLDTKTKHLKLSLDFGASTINVHELDDANMAYRATFQNANHIKEDLEQSGDTATITLSEQSSGAKFWEHIRGRQAELSLNKTVPTQLNLTAGASKQDLDFSKINLEKLNLDLGASTGDITFGSRANDLTALIDSGASSFTIHVPKEVGLEITSDSGLNSNNFTEVGLTKTDDTFRTPDFNAQTHKITIKLDAGASSIKLDRY